MQKINPEGMDPALLFVLPKQQQNVAMALDPHAVSAGTPLHNAALWSRAQKLPVAFPMPKKAGGWLVR
jgi:hypothetical protein